jgi:Phosphoesterase family
MSVDHSHAMDHIVVVLFENRSFDNVLGHLYGPVDGKAFEGVIGKDLSNPIPEWAEHGAERQTVPYTVAADMDSPNPDSGEEYPHTWHDANRNTNDATFVTNGDPPEETVNLDDPAIAEYAKRRAGPAEGTICNPETSGFLNSAARKLAERRRCASRSSSLGPVLISVTSA